MLAFLALAGGLLSKREQNAQSMWLAVAALTTATWAGVVAMADRFGGNYLNLVSPFETLRTAAWIIFLVSLLARSWRLSERISSSFIFAVAMGFVFAAQLLFDAANIFSIPGSSLSNNPFIAYGFILGRLICSIGGLVLVHNVYVNAIPGHRWSLQLICIGLGGFFIYDLNLYTLAALSGMPSVNLYNARGIVNTLIVPLIALSARRNRLWNLEIQVSRQVVFHSLSLIAVGAYLILMSIAAYGLRLIGGDWGSLLQVSFLFGTIIFAAVVIFSGRFRAWAKVKINKHFFAYKYDYREEWLRFISTLSGTNSGSGALESRVIQAVCDIVDSPGGALWMPDDDGIYTMASRWNYRTALNGAEKTHGPLIRFLRERQRIIDFSELRKQTGDYDDLTTPAWAGEESRAWLGVPLLHLDKLIGFLVIEQPRAPRTLNWEDFDLLRTIGKQSASYLAEQNSQAALLEAQQFDAFNRRFAFIMHDIKNLVSQLSLVARNAERHAENPEFQKDMVLTIRDSVGKMNDLLARLKQHNTGKADATSLNIIELLQEVVSTKARGHQLLTLHCDGGALIVQGDTNRLEQVFAHLIQNAIDASTADEPIDVKVEKSANEIRIQICDNGCGMTEEFIRGDLFKPFRSTKKGGFGIGAYEAREIIKTYGGHLDVSSRIGEGSIFTVTLPAT